MLSYVHCNVYVNPYTVVWEIYKRECIWAFFSEHNVENRFDHIRMSRFFVSTVNPLERLSLFVHWCICIADAPKNLQITPRQSTYEPGDKIHCSAEGNPEPSYQWTNLVNGTFTNRSILVISKDMVGKNHTFQCTAINSYDGTSHRNSTIVNFTVTAESHPIRTTHRMYRQSKISSANMNRFTKCLDPQNGDQSVWYNEITNCPVCDLCVSCKHLFLLWSLVFTEDFQWIFQ